MSQDVGERGGDFWEITSGGGVCLCGDSEERATTRTLIWLSACDLHYHGGDEGGPGEGHVVGAGDRDAQDHGEEGGVHLYVCICWGGERCWGGCLLRSMDAC